jgi:tripartite-type tricarboxylate transporter receptor subunit TctC
MDRFTRRLSAGLLLAFAPLCAFAQGLSPTFPSRPVHIVVPNPPGGAMDILGRLYASQLQPLWGQPVVVEYKPGANTVVGTEFVARSAPDGYTMGVVATGHVINPALRKLPYDTLKDLAGIALIGTSPVLISATPGLPVTSVAEVIELARRPGSRLSYATPGAGSAMHLAGEMLKLLTKVDIQHIPFKGSGPSYPEVMAGRVELLIDPLFSSMPYVRSGKFRALAVTSAQRIASVPDIPALAEYLPGFSVESLNGLVVPGQTPRSIVNRLNSDVLRILQAPEVKAKMAEFGIIPAGSTPEQFDALAKTEIDKWQKVVTAAKVTVDN